MINFLKRFWKTFLLIAEAGGTARAAAELNRRGMYKEARALMLK